MNQPIVIDNGSGVIKAGFAGQDQPKCFFSSCIGRPKYVPIMAGATDEEFFIGKRAQELRGLLALYYPMEHGRVETDRGWEAMERIWSWLYSEELKCEPEEHPVLLTEAPLNPKKQREIAAQLFFETFNVPSMHISIQAVLSLYASGRTTGIVLDSGDGVSHTVPVYEGFAVPNAIQRIDLAGRDVSEYLTLLLRKSGSVFQSSAEREIVRLVKEKTCYVAANVLKEEKEKIGKFDDFVLPDGKVIKIGSERFLAPEILFNPEMAGLEMAGVHQNLIDSIQRTDVDLRRSLYTNIVLSGGSTLFRGFGDRLLSEINKIAHKDVKIKIYAPPERKYSTWIGGSILASLTTFKKMWVTNEEYQEDPGIIHKRFF